MPVSTPSALPEHLGSRGSALIPRPRPGTQYRSRAREALGLGIKLAPPTCLYSKDRINFPSFFKGRRPQASGPRGVWTPRKPAFSARRLRQPQSARGSASQRAERRARAPHPPAQVRRGRGRGRGRVARGRGAGARRGAVEEHSRRRLLLAPPAAVVASAAQRAALPHFGQLP